MEPSGICRSLEGGRLITLALLPSKICVPVTSKTGVAPPPVGGSLATVTATLAWSERAPSETVYVMVSVPVKPALGV